MRLIDEGSEDKEDSMEQKEKPRICEILGVEVNQWFQIDYPHRDYFWLAVKEDGKIWEVGEHPHKVGTNALYYLIEHSGEIVCMPDLSEQEQSAAKMFCEAYPDGAIWRDPDDTLYLDDGKLFTDIPNRLFPSLPKGSRIKLSWLCGVSYV